MTVFRRAPTMRPVRFRHGETFTAEQIAEMQARLAALEQLSTNQQHQIMDQQSEMLHLRTILLAVGRTMPDVSDVPTLPSLPIVRSQTALPESLPTPLAATATAQVRAETPPPASPALAHPRQEPDAQSAAPRQATRP